MNQHILTGQVDVTSNLHVGSSHLFVDTTNNRVGLVTNDPHAGLHVNSNAYVDTDLRVGSQVEINTTPGRVKAVSFEGDGSLIRNAPVGSLAVHSTDTGLPGTDAIVTNEGTPTAAEFKFVIPRGDVGATGAAATVAVGTTTTGAAGSDASVTNSGTTSAAVFDFTVPRGDQGIQGIQGIQGETGTAATVAVGTTTTGTPGTNASVTNTGSSSAASFDFTIPRGDTGATGPAGTVAIGTTTTGAAGSSASVTNTGTSTAANLEFTIPKGDQGIQGVQGPAATIAVGTTTTSAPGTDGSVTNSGSSSAAVFDFVVPRGADGTNYFTLSGSDIYRSSGNVGIGTSSPEAKLHLYQSAGSANLVEKHTNASTGDYQQHINYTHYASVASGASRDPDNSRGLWIGNMVDENDASPSGANFAAFTDSFQFYAVADRTKYDSSLSFTSNTDDLLYSGGTFNKVMRINANGNVGIGTTDPGAPLDVFAPVASGTQRTALKLTTPESTTGTGCNLDFFQNTANVGRLASVYEAAGQLGMSFSTWNSGLGERVRIDASGNVGIGTTDPDAKLHVNGGNLRISAGAGGGLYDNGYQWLECDNDASWYRLTRTAKTNGIACYNGIAINQEGGLVVGSWDSPNALGVGNGKFTGTVTASTFSATSQVYLGTSASIRQSSSTWTGDPGSGVGKLEYHSNRWYVVAGSNSTELLRVRRDGSDKFFITNEGNIGRTGHSNGFLVGSYNSVGANDTKTNPIYTIGSSYMPSDTSLNNMYGIGYSHGNFTSMLTSGWGMYVASDGDARIGLNAQHGHIKCTGHVYCGNTVYVGGSTSRGLRSVSGNYGTVQTTGEGAGNHEGYSINGRWVFMSGDANSCGIYNDTDNKWAVLCYRNAQVRLDYNGNEKLKTEGGGVTVTGEINASAFSTRGTGSFGYNFDGVFMRPDGQVYISVDDNFYFRDNASTSSNLRRHLFDTNNGHIYAEGTVYSNYGLDYAEYFEWFDGNPDNEDRIGCSVSLVENTNKIKKCEPGEIPLGVVSGTSSMTGGGAGIHWNGYWKNDEWGRATYEQMEDDNGELVFNEDGTPKMKRAINPDYDENLDSEYLTRDQRKEWACVGLLGQVFVKKGGVTSKNWIKMKEVDSVKDLWFINAVFVDNEKIETIQSDLQAEKVKTKNLEALVLSLITRVQKLEQK